MASQEASKVSVEFRNGLALLWIGHGENRFNLQFLKELNSALDQVEENESIKFMITIGKGKFYSNGLDLDRIVKMREPDRNSLNIGIHTLFLRMLIFPVPTIAALNGHTFAGGAVFAISHDYRVMRTKRGWFCFPEIHLPLSFSDGLISLLNAKITDPRVRTDSIIMGKRYTAEEALSAKLVDQICDNSELLNKAIQLGWAVVGKEQFNRNQTTALKSKLYRIVVEDLKSSINPEQRNTHPFSKL